MVLGETLSSALAYVMQSWNIRVRGWHVDVEGWGPPPFVWRKMNEYGWCKRSRELLKIQLGRNASLLYVAMQMTLAQGDIGEAVHPEVGSDKKYTEERCYYVEVRRALR